MESHGLPDIHPKPLTTPKRYGAGMAHTVASIGHVLSCSYYRLLWIIDYHGLSCNIVDYLGLSMIIMDYGLRWIMDCHGLSWINWVMDDGLSCIGLLLLIVVHCGVS